MASVLFVAERRFRLSHFKGNYIICELTPLRNRIKMHNLSDLLELNTEDLTRYRQLHFGHSRELAQAWRHPLQVELHKCPGPGLTPPAIPARHPRRC
jgi:hypothetical protein